MTQSLSAEEIAELQRLATAALPTYALEPRALFYCEARPAIVLRLLAMASRLVELESALTFLDESGWAHPRYTEARNKFRTPGSSTFSVDQCIAFARELGWPGPTSQAKGG